YDGKYIRLKQSKTGARVVIPVGAPLKVALDTAPKQSTFILTTAEGKPWTSDGFRASWRKACAKAGIVGITFNDLRGTTVSARRMHRGRDSDHYWAQPSRRALHTRCTLFASRSRAGRERHQEARKENRISQMNAQMVWAVLFCSGGKFRKSL